MSKHRRFGASIAAARAQQEGAPGSSRTAAAAGSKPGGKPGSQAGDSQTDKASGAAAGGDGAAQAPRKGAAAAAAPGGAGASVDAAAAGVGPTKAGSVYDVQACVWLHLRLLLPLLPTVRADREVNPHRNLRHKLSSVLPQLLLSPYVRADHTAAAAAVSSVAGLPTQPAAAAVPGASGSSSMPVYECLLLMLSALLCGDWAGWLRGPNKRLREVPVQADITAVVRSKVLAATVGGSCNLPCSYQQRILAALPIPGPVHVQLPSPLIGPAAATTVLQPVHSTGPGQAADALQAAGSDQKQQWQQQREHIAQHWDVWVPVCAASSAHTSRRPAAAAAAAMDVDAAAHASGGRPAAGAAAGADPDPAAAAAAAVAQLLKGCVRQQRQKLLYTASGYDSD